MKSGPNEHSPGQQLPHCSTLASMLPTFFSGFQKFPARPLHSFNSPLGTPKMLSGLPTALNCYFPELPHAFYFSKPFIQYTFHEHMQCSYIIMVWCWSFIFANFRKAWQLEHAGTGITEVFLWKETWWDTVCIGCRIFRNDGVQSRTLWGESQRNQHCHITYGSEGQMSKRRCPAPGLKAFHKRRHSMG